MIRFDVVIVGAGASGASVAVQLLRASRRPLRLALIDPDPGTGRGVAYRSPDPRHVLNVVAEKMSAVEDDPTHFLRWASRRGWEAEPGDFLPRWAFGAYLEEEFERARSARPDAALERIVDRVVDLVDGPRGHLVVLEGGRRLPATTVVLATGAPPPPTDWVPDGLRRSAAPVVDPWSSGALDAIPESADVLVVGTGLSMVDVVVSLQRSDRVVHAVSRHGLLPRAHDRSAPPGRVPGSGPPTADLAGLRSWWLGHLRQCLRADGDWRPAVDGVRGLTPALWGALSLPDREQFLSQDARWWSTVRHRLAPSTARDLDVLRRTRRLIIHRGEVIDAVCGTAGPAVRIELSNGVRLDVGAVVNASGPGQRTARDSDPLSTRLLRRGTVRQGPCGIGYDTDHAGRLVGAGGEPTPTLVTLGASRRGTLWESTAFPEIRSQAAAVSEAVLVALGTVATDTAPTGA